MAKSAAQESAGEPPKKKRLTAQEKAERDAEKLKQKEEREKKKAEKEEAEKLKAQQKAAKEEEKAARAAEKAEKEQEKKQRAEEREKKEQEKKQRAEEREKRKREKDEEEAKKARSQMKLTSMFNRTATTPKKDSASKPDNAQAPGSTSKNEAKETSLYDQMFKPFFVKEHVRLAPTSFQMDEETREAKTRILDEYLSGKREHPRSTRWKPSRYHTKSAAGVSIRASGKSWPISRALLPTPPSISPRNHKTRR
jgi:chromatin assembly factor 1 subunit A